MRRLGLTIVAVGLALMGCQSTDSKPGDQGHGNVAVRPKSNKDKTKDATPAKTPAWLDEVTRLPGAGTGIPKSTPTGDPRNPLFDPKTAAQDVLGGRVVDPNGKPARNIYVRIEEVGSDRSQQAPMGIYTKDDGYFLATGWKPGHSYELTAHATTTDGRKLTGVVQTKVPNPVLLIVLRDDLPPPPITGRPPSSADDKSFPPSPRPSDAVHDAVPSPPSNSPASTVPRPTPTRPSDGAWTPHSPTPQVPPATLSPSPPTSGIPTPPPLHTPAPSPVGPPNEKPEKPENIAETPKDPFKPPAANIPVGPPPIPALPPLTPPGAGKSSMAQPTGRSTTHWQLLDTLERPWNLDTVPTGSLVLLEFITSTCLPCKQVIPVMRDLQSRYGASGLQVVAVLCDNTPLRQRIATASKYSRDQNLNYPIFVEAGDTGSVRDQFDVEVYPTAVLLDTTGRVLWKGHPGQKALVESAIQQHLRK
ncbi:MAG: redoxin domain-containing protein [Gemmataceae bacterium]|nr:redoxin domain-containing protein [Gemmata sp.]MDW8197704.1 redoxin domain-containing protein [Gemmataceae bacterium]